MGPTQLEISDFGLPELQLGPYVEGWRCIARAGSCESYQAGGKAARKCLTGAVCPRPGASWGLHTMPLKLWVVLQLPIVLDSPL